MYSDCYDIRNQHNKDKYICPLPLMLEGSNEIFDVSVVDFIDIIRYNVGDEVTVEYKEGEKANTVLSLTGDPK